MPIHKFKVFLLRNPVSQTGKEEPLRQEGNQESVDSQKLMREMFEERSDLLCSVLQSEYQRMSSMVQRDIVPSF